MSAFLRLCLRYWRQISAVVVVLALIGWAWSKVTAYGDDRFQAGRNAVIAADAIAQAQADIEREVRQALADRRAAALHHDLDLSLPAIEVQSYAAIDKIHTLYLAQPVAAVCVRPAGVQDELDAALRRANTAASGSL